MLYRRVRLGAVVVVIITKETLQRTCDDPDPVIGEAVVLAVLSPSLAFIQLVVLLRRLGIWMYTDVS